MTKTYRVSVAAELLALPIAFMAGYMSWHQSSARTVIVPGELAQLNRTSLGRVVARGSSAKLAIAEPRATNRTRSDISSKLLKLTLHEVFEEEERDELWAPDVENVLLDTFSPYQRGLIPYATKSTVECRTNVCELSMLVPSIKRVEAMHLIQGLPIGDRRGPSATEDELPPLPPLPPGQARIVLSVTFALDKATPLSIRNDVEQATHRRFPDGYESVRKHIDDHPEALEPIGPAEVDE